MIELNGEKRVKIESEDGFTHVFVEGKEVRRVREISFHQSVDEFPIVHLDVYAEPVIEMDANVEMSYSPDEYLRWLDKEIENEGAWKPAFMMCRARYLSYIGRSYEDRNIIS